MVVLCCGDRDWTDSAAIAAEFARRPEITTVVHGACRGADLLCADAAVAARCVVISEPADWTRYGRAAGPIRNQRMLDLYPIDLVLAFHANLAASRGTADMVNRARRRGVPVIVITGR
jgi:hypothetical protein